MQLQTKYWDSVSYVFGQWRMKNDSDMQMWFFNTFFFLLSFAKATKGYIYFSSHANLS